MTYIKRGQIQPNSAASHSPFVMTQLDVAALQHIENLHLHNVPVLYTALLIIKAGKLFGKDFTSSLQDDNSILEQLPISALATIIICGLISLPYAMVSTGFDSYKTSIENGDSPGKLTNIINSAMVAILGLITGALYLPTMAITTLIDFALAIASYPVDVYLHAIARNSLHGSIENGHSIKRLRSPSAHNVGSFYKGNTERIVITRNANNNTFTALFIANYKTFFYSAVTPFQPPSESAHQLNMFLHAVLTLPYSSTAWLQHKATAYNRDKRTIGSSFLWGMATMLNWVVGIATEVTSAIVDFTASHVTALASISEDLITKGALETHVTNKPITYSRHYSLFHEDGAAPKDNPHNISIPYDNYTFDGYDGYAYDGSADDQISSFTSENNY